MKSAKALPAATTILLACTPAAEPAVATPSVPAAASAVPAASASTAAASPGVPSTPSEVLESNRSSFDACYAQARTTDPALGRTKVEMTFIVNAEGRPQSVDLKYRNRFDDRAKECMRDAALSLHFPPSMQGTQTATLVFTPPGS